MDYWDILNRRPYTIELKKTKYQNQRARNNFLNSFYKIDDRGIENEFYIMESLREPQTDNAPNINNSSFIIVEIMLYEGSLNFHLFRGNMQMCALSTMYLDSPNPVLFGNH